MPASGRRDGHDRPTPLAIEPEPNAPLIRGERELDRLDVDLIIAVCGGSVLDASKVMRLFHEIVELLRTGFGSQPKESNG